MDTNSSKLSNDIKNELRNDSQLELKKLCATQEFETDITILRNIQKIEVFNYQDNITDANFQLLDLKMQIDFLNEEIILLSDNITEQTDENKKIFLPSINSDYEKVLNQVTMQKHENVMLSKQLHDLQKEKIVLDQQVIAFQSRIQSLEEQIGH